MNKIEKLKIPTEAYVKQEFPQEIGTREKTNYANNVQVREMFNKLNELIESHNTLLDVVNELREDVGSLYNQKYITHTGENVFPNP